MTHTIDGIDARDQFVATLIRFLGRIVSHDSNDRSSNHLCDVLVKSTSLSLEVINILQKTKITTLSSDISTQMGQFSSTMEQQLTRNAVQILSELMKKFVHGACDIGQSVRQHPFGLFIIIQLFFLLFLVNLKLLLVVLHDPLGLPLLIIVVTIFIFYLWNNRTRGKLTVIFIYQ